MKNYFIFIFYLISITATLVANTPSPSSSNNKKNMCPELTGRVIWPKDAHYHTARLVSNYYSSKNSFPKVIVYCQNTQDVQNAIKWARCQNIPVRVRSGGHNHEGFSTGSDALVVDVSEMKKLHIDKSKNIVTTQAGVTGGELYRKLFKEGLTQVGGTCQDVGISGLILTGGMGPLMRIYGMSCDSLVALEMVDANGEILQVTPYNEYKDLFWASCGGGGNMGVVTSLTLKVYPAKSVTWFNIGWNWDQPVENIISTWQGLFLSDNAKWFSHLDLWAKAFPADHYKKKPIKALGVYYGTPEEAKRDLAPLLKIGHPSEQTIEFVDWEKAIHLFEDATSVFITDKPEYKSSGAFAMKALPADAINIIVSTLQNTSSPLLNVLFFSLGGAAAKKPPTDTAYFYRQARFFLVYSTQWLQPSGNVKQMNELDSLRQRLLPYGTQGAYLGNPDRNFKDYLTEYYGDNVQKLRRIKRKYDPQNLFQHEQGIPPAKEN